MKNIFLEKSIPEILKLLINKEVSGKDLLDVAKAKYNIEGKEFKVWNSFSLNNNVSDLYKINNDLNSIPFAAKDIFNTTNFSTERGSPIYKDYYPGNNARVIDSLITSGAHLVGKTITAEFAVHELNDTLNPHDISRTPGTSSSGSAVAVQIGNVPFALGTQTAASIMRPASFNGVWGIKPSFGIVPRTGILKTADTLDTVGFFTSHGRSIRSILNSIRVKGPNYPLVFKNMDNKIVNLSKYKIGIIKTKLWKQTKDYIRDYINKFAETIQNDKNINVEEIEMPKEFDDMHHIHNIIYYKSLSYYFKNEFEDRSKISKIMNSIILKGKDISTKEFIDALKKQQKFSDKLNDIFKGFDCCISSTTSSSAVLRGNKEIDDPSLLWTMAGIPAINIPGSYCPEKLPFGIQLISKKWDDYILLNFLDYLFDHEYISPLSLKKYN